MTTTPSTLASEIQVKRRKITHGQDWVIMAMIGRNLLNSQTPLLFLLADFPMLFVCSDMTCWCLETGQGREGFGIRTTHCPPHPHKALSSSYVSGALGSDSLLPGARDTLFCLLSHPDCPGVVLPQGGGGKWQRLFWNKSFFFLPSLSPSTPSKCKNILASFHHLGLVLEIWICSCSL